MYKGRAPEESAGAQSAVWQQLAASRQPCAAGDSNGVAHVCARMPARNTRKHQQSLFMFARPEMSRYHVIGSDGCL